MTGDAETRRLSYIRDTASLLQDQARAGREAVLGNRTERDALLWRLYTVADAAHGLSEELKARHADIPWDRVRGFRNVAAHGYLELAMDAAWEIVEYHLAVLKAAVEQELGERELE